MKRIVSLILSAALCAAALFSLVGCAGQDKINNGLGDIWDGFKEGVEEGIGDIVNPTSFEMVNSDRVALALLDDAAAIPSAMTATLVATVKPEDATDKSVDWSVYWINNAEGEEALVSDYLTINPTADGSTTAIVTVHQPFAGSTIGIKVTTRVGGYSAECRATYIGMPNAAEILVPDELKDDTGRIQLAPNNTYTFEIALSNVFGEVSEEYLADHADLACFVTGAGSIVCSSQVSNAVVGVLPGEDAEFALDSIKGEFIAVELVEGKLVVTVSKALQDYKNLVNNDPGTGIPESTLYSYKSGAEGCYFIISITDNNANISAIVNVRIEVNANGVELSDPELQF